MSQNSTRLVNRQDARRPRNRARFMNLLDTLEDRTLLSIAHAASVNHPPKGVITSSSNTQVIGYVSDVDAKNTALSVQVIVDGDTASPITATADQARPAGQKGPATANWFVVNLTGLSAGPHNIQVMASDLPSGDFVKVAQGTTPNQKPKGQLLVANQDTISGFAWDPDSPSDPVEIFLSLTSGGKKSQPTDQGPANQVITDPSILAIVPDANHGFSFATPTILFGKNTVQIFAKDTTDGSLTLLGTSSGKTMTFVNNKPKGSLTAATATGVAGYVFDPDVPTQPVEVLLYIDGQFVTKVLATTARNDLVPKKLPNANHGFSLGFSGLPKGKHTIQVFAVDGGHTDQSTGLPTGVTSLLGSKTVTVK